MKVVFVSTLYHPYAGGAERILQVIAEGVVEAGHQAVVICLQKTHGTASSEIKGVKVYRIGIKNLYWPFDGYRPLPALRGVWAMIEMYNVLGGRQVGKILDAEKPSLVNTHTLAGHSPSVWHEVKRRQIPLVHTMVDYWLLCAKTTMFRRGKACERPCPDCKVFTAPRRRLSSRVDFATADAKYLLKKHLNCGLFKNGQPTRWIHNATKMGTATRRKTSASENKLVLGFMGRIEPSKGVEVLLEALAGISQGWEVHIAGRGLQPYESQLIRRFESGRVKFLGFVEPKNLFANIDVLVVPSVWEDPLPTVIFEAYAHGIPVIGSSRGGIPELIDEGKTGFVFEHKICGGLADVVKRFIDDPQLAVSMRSSVLAKASQYHPNRLTNEYLAIYSQLLDGMRFGCKA